MPPYSPNVARFSATSATTDNAIVCFCAMTSRNWNRLKSDTSTSNRSRALGGRSNMEPSGTLEHTDDEAFVIVKAAPRVSPRYGATVCCAAIDRNGSWVRLYPVSFRYLEERQKFGRWDRIRYRWRSPRAAADLRSESRRVDDRSIEILGSLPVSERGPLIHRTAVTSLKAESLAGRSLALLKMEVLEFRIERRSAGDVDREIANRKSIREQGDMFQLSESIAADASPFSFKYVYRDDDDVHTGTCQDWETEATFLRRRAEFQSEQRALD